jgi:hypothetical protein
LRDANSHLNNLDPAGNFDPAEKPACFICHTTTEPTSAAFFTIVAMCGDR